MRRLAVTIGIVSLIALLAGCGQQQASDPALNVARPKGATRPAAPGAAGGPAPSKPAGGGTASASEATP